MVHLGFNADIQHGKHHLGADVLQRIRGRCGEITLFIAKLMTEVGTLVGARVPGGLDRIHLVEGMILRLIEAHIIENEKLRLGTEVSHVANTGRV